MRTACNPQACGNATLAQQRPCSWTQLIPQVTSGNVQLASKPCMHQHMYTLQHRGCMNVYQECVSNTNRASLPALQLPSHAACIAVPRP
jgi:hypothetical protein